MNAMEKRIDELRAVVIALGILLILTMVIAVRWEHKYDRIKDKKKRR